MLDFEKLRQWWAKKQVLDGNLQTHSPAEVLEKTGWARSVGGVNPYITLFARAGISREDADAAAARMEIYELPSARSCTYVLPASDFAIGLKAGQGFGDEASLQTAIKHLGVTEKEIDKLMDRVVAALSSGMKDPRELKDAVGNTIRNLGEAGKKKGITTTLPLALGRLQSHGKIKRVPANGRLDQQRYSYALWSPSPLEKTIITQDEAYVELARRYFRWIGPASIENFRWFSGLGAKAAKAAINPIGVVPFERDSDLLIYPDDLEAYHHFKKSRAPHYEFVSSIDGIILLRRELKQLIDEQDQKVKVADDRRMIEIGQLSDLPSHAIVDRGRIVGLWEYDPDKGRVAWKSFGKPDDKVKAAASHIEKYIREQLGDARSFSLDSPESRKPRIQALQ